MKKKGGKFLGAALGYTFGGPFGALLGAAIGYAVDEDPGRPGPPRAREGRAPRFHEGVRAGDRLRRDPRPLSHGGGQGGRAGHRRKGGNHPPFLRGAARVRRPPARAHTTPHRRVVPQGPSIFPGSAAAISARTVYEERLFLIQLAYRVSVADGVLARSEETYIDRRRGCSASRSRTRHDRGALRRFREGAGDGSGGPGRRAVPNPYAVLGVPPSASDEEIQRVYRLLAGKYHPDKVLHLGQEFIDLAHRKFTMIALAYETIKKRTRSLVMFSSKFFLITALR